MAEPRKKGYVMQTVERLSLEGKTSREIRQALVAEDVPYHSIHTALNRLRRRGKIAPRQKVHETRYQICLHAKANARLVQAAVARGLAPADLAKIWLTLATKELAS